MLLSTCCHTRAVRLEVLFDLSVDSLLLALTRLAARGVNPHTILSDNGGNFDGANRLLRHLWNLLEASDIQTRKPTIVWKFNPPYASHYGGVFERLIGAAKSALYHALPSHFSLTLEQLYTAFAEVEGLLNARPLAYVSGDGRDPTPLTPNHFLAGSASIPVVSSPWDVGEAPPLPPRWKAVLAAMEQFRQRFMKEVLPHLRETNRKRGSGRDFKPGDIVTFLLPSSHLKWPLAQITRTFPGPDGRVRTVELWRPPSDPLPQGGKFIVPPSQGPIKNATANSARARPPISGASDKKEGRGQTLRRDVGSIALLLPVEQTHLHQI